MSDLKIEKTMEEKLKSRGLLKSVGVRAMSLDGIYKRATPPHKFILPRAGGDNDYLPINTSIIEQDVKAAALGTIEFSMLKIIPKSVDLKNILKLNEIKDIRLGTRELAVLLTDYVDRGETSYLEELRIQKGVTNLAFPGTVLFSYERVGLKGRHKAYSLETAYYWGGSLGHYPFEHGWHRGKVTFFLDSFVHVEAKTPEKVDLSLACLCPPYQGWGELGTWGY